MLVIFILFVYIKKLLNIELGLIQRKNKEIRVKGRFFGP